MNIQGNQSAEAEVSPMARHAEEIESIYASVYLV